MKSLRNYIDSNKNIEEGFYKNIGSTTLLKNIDDLIDTIESCQWDDDICDPRFKNYNIVFDRENKILIFNGKRNRRSFKVNLLQQDKNILGSLLNTDRVGCIDRILLYFRGRQLVFLDVTYNRTKGDKFGYFDTVMFKVDDILTTESFYKNVGAERAAQIELTTQEFAKKYGELLKKLEKSRWEGDAYNLSKFIKISDCYALIDIIHKYPEGSGFKVQWSEEGRWKDLFIVHLDGDNVRMDFDSYGDDVYTMNHQYYKAIYDIFTVDLKMNFEPYDSTR